MNGQRLRTLPLSSTFVDALLLAVARALKDEAVKRKARRRAESRDVTPTKILRLLEGGNCRRSEIRGWIGCANSKIAPAVAELLASGFITESAVKTRGRATTELSITDAGIAKLREAAA